MLVLCIRPNDLHSDAIASLASKLEVAVLGEILQLPTMQANVVVVVAAAAAAAAAAVADNDDILDQV